MDDVGEFENWRTVEVLIGSTFEDRFKDGLASLEAECAMFGGWVDANEESFTAETVIEDSLEVYAVPAMFTLPEEEWVASIGEDGFETLADAVAAANADTTTEGAVTIHLLKNVTFDAALTVTRDTIIKSEDELEEYKGDKTITRAYAGSFMTVASGATLKLDNITVDGGNNWTFDAEAFKADAVDGVRKGNDAAKYFTYEEGAIIADNNSLINVNGTLILDSGTTIKNNVGCTIFSVPNGGKLYTNDCTISHNTKNTPVVASISAGGYWEINSGANISGNHSYPGNGTVSYMSGTTVMNGGLIEDNTGVDCNASVIMVYGGSASFTMNGGTIRANGASYGNSNGWNASFYVYGNGATFTMNDGVIEGNYSESIPGIANNGSNAIINLNGGKILNTQSGRGFAAKDVYAYCPVTVTNEVDSATNGFYNNVTNTGVLNGNSWFYSNAMTYSGGGTFNGNVTVQSGAETTMVDGRWINGLVTVKAVGNDTTLTVKEGATIDGIQVRVLDSVASGDYLNAAEAAEAQAASYVEEEGANVVSPVLYYHRLTGDQKSNIVVTFDYNGGLDAQGWSGCQLTSAEDFAPELPAPINGSLKLLGWTYAEDNDPESLSMAGDAAYAGEEISASLRLIAQWGEPDYVCYIKETGVYYETLTEAVADANTLEGANTIVMIKDIDFDSDKALTVSGDLTIISEPEHEEDHVISRGAYTGTLFTVPAGSSLTLDGGITFDGSNNWIFDKELYENDLYNRVDNPITAYAYSAEGGTCGTAAAFVVNGTVTAKDATIQNFFSTKDSNAGDAAIFKVNANATLTTDGVKIDHCATYGANTVAHLAKDAKWYIQGNTMISNNFGGRNGGICRNDSGQIYMSGGTIKDTAGKNVNGTVFMMYGTGSAFYMTGGTICHNSSTFGVNNGRCAAVYLHANSYMKMTGGTICHNIGGTRGGIDSYKSSSVLDINRVDQTFVDGVYANENGKDAYTASNHPYIVDNVSLIDNTSHDVGHSFNFDTWWVTGGIYTQDVDEFCSAGYICIPYDDSERPDDYIVVPAYRVKYYEVKEVQVTNPETGAVTTETQAELLYQKYHLLERDKFWYEMDERVKNDYVYVDEETGKKIDTWYTEKELTNIYDFENTKLEGDLNLYGEIKTLLTYDYNEGKVGEEYKSVVTFEEDSYNPSEKGLPTPTNGSLTLIGWKYAVDTNPESTDMTDTGKWYMGETLTTDTRLIAQWDNVPENEGPEHDKPFVLEPQKESEVKNRTENRYTVTIDVPGADGENVDVHDEVILMVDGSYSMDNEWPAMKEAINTIGKAVLNGSGITQLTLMAFGMGDNEVLVHVKDADELAASLGALPGNLLYGRSSTNCEAGFDGVANYIKNHDESLHNVQVIFISDGNINTDETPRAFAQNWKLWTKFGALVVAQEAFCGTVFNGENLPAAFTTVFGDRFDGASREEIVNRALGGEVTDAEFLAFADQVWEDVYDYSGLYIGVKYPVSVAERAFVKYDKEKGTYIQDLFYYTTFQSAYVGYGDRWTRTPVAANELAAMEEVSAMYVVDYDGYTAWMDTGITSEKSTFIKSNGIAGLVDALDGALVEMAKTPFNDVTITDPMSKWVNLDPNSIKIIDNNTGKTLWTVNGGWTTATKLTADAPVVVTKVADPANSKDEAIKGNTSGDVYKITWKVKDGALLRTDNYRLSYEVIVDTDETGFVYGTDYVANGLTYATYEDANGDKAATEIDVPDVYAKTIDLVVKKVDEQGNALNGAEFKLLDADGKEVETFTAGEHTLKLDVGTYTLEETKAPKDCRKLKESIQITIGSDANGNATFSVTGSDLAKYENGALVVTNEAFRDAAVVLTVDMSGTMYRYKMNGTRYVDIAKQEALDFVTEYTASAFETGNGGKRMLAVARFDTDAEVVLNWVDVSTEAGFKAAVEAINAMKVKDNGSTSSRHVCTNFDGGVILTRNLLRQVQDTTDMQFAMILSDGAPTVTVNADTDKVGTIKSSFWGNQLDATGKMYQKAYNGGGWTHPAEVAKTLTYMKAMAELTYNDGEGVLILGVGGHVNNGVMGFKLFYDAVYGTSNGSRTSDVKRKPAAFNNIDALEDYTQAQILKLTTEDWMNILATQVGGAYKDGNNPAAVAEGFQSILTTIKNINN